MHVMAAPAGAIAESKHPFGLIYSPTMTCMLRCRRHLYGDVYSSPGLGMRQKQVLMVAFLGQADMQEQLFGHLLAVRPPVNTLHPDTNGRLPGPGGHAGAALKAPAGGAPALSHPHLATQWCVRHARRCLDAHQLRPLALLVARQDRYMPASLCAPQACHAGVGLQAVEQ